MSAIYMIRSSWFWLWLSLTAFCFSLLGYLAEGLFTPVPYRNVDVIVAEIVGDEFRMVANFEKTDCVFVRLTVIGYEGQISERLNWVDNDDLGPALDREIGFHTLRISADLGGLSFDRIQVITRHDCDGEKVDKVFTEYAL